MNISESTQNRFAAYFSDDYYQARNAFRDGAEKNPQVSLTETIEISAKGYNCERELSLILLDTSIETNTG